MLHGNSCDDLVVALFKCCFLGLMLGSTWPLMSSSTVVDILLDGVEDVLAETPLVVLSSIARSLSVKK